MKVISSKKWLINTDSLLILAMNELTAYFFLLKTFNLIKIDNLEHANRTFKATNHDLRNENRKNEKRIKALEEVDLKAKFKIMLSL